MPFSDLSAHIEEAFSCDPTRYDSAIFRARQAHLARHRAAQDTYRWKHPGRAAENSRRRWYAGQPHVLARRVWREIQASHREQERRRKEVAWELWKLRAGWVA